MAHIFFSLFFSTISLILLTLIFIVRDRVHESRIKRDFYIAFALLIAVFLFESVLSNFSFEESSVSFFLTMLRCFFAPILVSLWLDISLRDEEDIFSDKKVYILLGINLILTAVSSIGYITHGQPNSILEMCCIVFSLFTQFGIALNIIGAVNRRAKRYNSSENLLIEVSFLLILIATIVEQIVNSKNLVEMVIANVICVYFFYIEIQIYKRDALTHLLTRHDLMNELNKCKHEEFYVSLIDVDDFKKINDKYGHEKGDEALCVVVDCIRAIFSDNSKIYRYGGDEFVILSFDATKEQIDEQFTKVNKLLYEKDKRVSYGCILHKSGDEVSEMLRQADLFMYENKRNKKMEDIWDDTTGTYNLKGFLEELDNFKKHAAAEKKAVLLGAFDIEHLGNINAEYGYSEGNFVIATLAEIMRNSLDSNGILGHLGSDSFVVAIKTNPGDTSPIVTFAESVNAGITHSPKFDKNDYFVEVSEAHDFMDVSVKSCEKEVNRVVGLNKAEKEDRRKKSYSSDIDYEEMGVDKEEEKFALNIIANNMFKYALQPIVSAKDGEVVAYEALMRTDTEPRMSPLTILRHANKNNRGYDIEKATFFNVLKLFRKIKDVIGDRRIFLNSIPGHLLIDDDYTALREEYSDLLNKVTVEITEQSELSDNELEIIRRRQEEDGNGIAIDDYGSGTSNTYNLLRIRPEVIKLDRLLISDIDTNTKKQYFVNSIVTFAKENGMLVLAEGVETEAEMKMVIRLHVDFIQGYYLAKPSFDVIENIDPEVKKVIITENMRGVSEGKRKIYLASNDNYLSLVQIALEEYTGITVSSPKLILAGSRDYEADMSIKIKDGSDVYLILRDVRLTSVDQLPCIDIGENAHLTLVLEGECSINHRGIHVPKSSKLEILGSGNLDVSTKGHDCYGIGAENEEEIGEIVLNHSGQIKVRVDGELAAAIGGGVYNGGEGIQIISGKLDISVACITGIGIGCVAGDMPIKIKDCDLDLDVRVNEGSAIGSLSGKQNIDISNYKIHFSGSGSKVAAIGTVFPSGGNISFTSGSIEGAMSGQDIYLVGTPEGELNVKFKNMRMEIKGEGNSVLAVGSTDKSSKIDIDEGTIDIIINAAEPVGFGAEDDNITIKGIPPVLKINA